MQQELKSDGIGDENNSQKNDVGNVSENTKEQPDVKSQISMVDLDRMVAYSLKDIDVFDDDGDDDDPDLMNELSQIIHPEEVPEAAAIDLSITATNSVSTEVSALLKQRIEMYKIAEANANSSNETSRARRFARGLSTLETMLKETLAGKAINMEDIPPEVIAKVKSESE